MTIWSLLSDSIVEDMFRCRIDVTKLFMLNYEVANAYLGSDLKNLYEFQRDVRRSSSFSGS
jgi:hypothetical protein